MSCVVSNHGAVRRCSRSSIRSYPKEIATTVASALGRFAKDANYAYRMDQNGVPTEGMESWDDLNSRREEQPLPIWPMARRDRERFREVGSLAQHQGRTHMPSPLEVPGRQLRWEGRWFVSRRRLLLDMAYRPIILDVVQLRVDMGPYAVAYFTVLARLWFG